MIYNNVLAKDLSFYIHELQQKKQKMDDIEKELHVELKNKSLEDLKKEGKYQALQSRVKLIMSEVDKLRKEILDFYASHPDYNTLPNAQKVISLISK
jgi:translation initiation factor 6 (eIF-6)